MTNWAQIFTGLLFYAYVEIHQVRILVFDNYKTCPVPLKPMTFNALEISKQGTMIPLLIDVGYQEQVTPTHEAETGLSLHSP